MEKKKSSNEVIIEDMRFRYSVIILLIISICLSVFTIYQNVEKRQNPKEEAITKIINLNKTQQSCNELWQELEDCKGKLGDISCRVEILEYIIRKDC